MTESSCRCKPVPAQIAWLEAERGPRAEKWRNAGRCMMVDPAASCRLAVRRCLRIRQADVVVDICSMWRGTTADAPFPLTDPRRRRSPVPYRPRHQSYLKCAENSYFDTRSCVTAWKDVLGPSWVLHLARSAKLPEGLYILPMFLNVMYVLGLRSDPYIQCQPGCIHINM